MHLFLYYTYLLQLENFHLRRFLSAVPAAILRFCRLPAGRYGPPRQKLVWTAKTTSVFLLAFLLYLLSVVVVVFIFRYFFVLSLPLVVFIALAALVILALLFFIHLAAATLLLWPLDLLLKKIILARARRHLLHFPNLTVIGITGSYGKTTVKEMLAAVLSEKYRVLKTPDNINTPLGVARLILNRLLPEHNVFIVEMGAYGIGDIRELCRLTPPDIAVLTGINEAHLERFGSINNTLAAKMEIIDFAKPDALVVLNTEDKNVRDHYQPHLENRRLVASGDFIPRLHNFHLDGSGWDLSLTDRAGREFGPYLVPLLGDYVTAALSLTLAVALELELDVNQIRRGLKNLKSISHRLEAKPGIGNVLIIDDSYNGNPAGARAAIRALSRFSGRRKIYVTPGLVEMGNKTEAVHLELGRLLASVVDLVFLIRTSAAPLIKKGLAAAGFDTKCILEFTSMPALEKELPRLLKENDVILFQNDWPDNYS